MKLKHIPATIDINSRNEQRIAGIVNINDKKTRYLDVTIIASGEKLDISGCTVTAIFVIDDVLVNNAVDCTVTNNIVTIPLENFNGRYGYLSIELNIVKDGTVIVNTPIPLKIQVTSSIADNAKISEKTYGTIAETVKEVYDARGTYENLSNRLTGIDNEITDLDETVTMKINLKADKADTENSLNQKIDTVTATQEIAKAKSEAITKANLMIDDYDKTQVQPALAKKADKADVTNQLSKLNEDYQNDVIPIFGGDYSLQTVSVTDNFYWNAVQNYEGSNNQYEYVDYDVSEFSDQIIKIYAYNEIVAHTCFIDGKGKVLSYWNQAGELEKQVPINAQILRVSNKKSNGKTYAKIKFISMVKNIKELNKKTNEMAENFNEKKPKVSGKPYKISFNGDSLTEGNGENAPSYVLTVVDNLLVDKYENNGKRGQSISYVSTTASKQTDADIVTVLVGTNNFGQNIQNLKAEWIKMYNDFKSNNVNYKDKLFLLITPTMRFDRENYTDLEKIADMIVEVGKELKIPVLDLYHFSTINEETYEMYLTKDKLHPNVIGARILGNEISNFISQCIMIKSLL